MMSNETAVYDLGVVDPVSASATRNTRPRAAPGMSATALAEPPRRSFDTIADSLELFVPGAGQLLRARWSDGLSVLTGTGFLIALAWAIWETLDRLSATLTTLGYPAQGGVYALGLIYACLAGLHAGNVLYGTTRGSARAHPVIAGFASTLIPGWGQLLNRQPAKAATFVAGLWTVGIAWLLASPWTAAWFDAQGLVFRPGFEVLSSPAVLWTAPIVLWVLSVYDAVATARH